MSEYRLWYVKRGERQQGPFPEPLVCRYIVLGRIGPHDVLSLDGHFWRTLDQLPELKVSVDAMLHAQGSVDAEVSEGDVNWREERAKAALRWLDDRKSPDPRGTESVRQQAENQERRQGGDRRVMPETVENHTYREYRATFESWIRGRRQHYGWALAVVVLFGLGTLAGALWLQPVHPVKVGLTVLPADCTVGAVKGVNWSGCDKQGTLLVGADLRGAELVGTRLQRANLQYADLTQANLSRADLSGADLTGVRLGGATWTDGRVCAPDSAGVCK